MKYFIVILAGLMGMATTNPLYSAPVFLSISPNTSTGVFETLKAPDCQPAPVAATHSTLGIEAKKPSYFKYNVPGLTQVNIFYGGIALLYIVLFGAAIVKLVKITLNRSIRKS